MIHVSHHAMRKGRKLHANEPLATWLLALTPSTRRRNDSRWDPVLWISHKQFPRWIEPGSNASSRPPTRPRHSAYHQSLVGLKIQILLHGRCIHLIRSKRGQQCHAPDRTMRSSEWRDSVFRPMPTEPWITAIPCSHNAIKKLPYGCGKRLCSQVLHDGLPDGKGLGNGRPLRHPV